MTNTEPAGRPRANRVAVAMRPLVLRFQRHVSNPIFRRLAPHLPAWAVIETTGRTSGQPRRNPVGGRLEGSVFWLVSEFGRDSHYVRNIVADPRVRVQLRGRWHSGTAVLVDSDDPRARLRQLPFLNGMMVRTVGTNLLTVRVDLDRAPG